MVKAVFLRSDNAGSYHNASLLLALPSLTKELGIRISRYDFSEAQAGKDICDRKIAPMKSHIQHYINEGHDVMNASQMHAALDSYGGERGCQAAVLALDTDVVGEKRSWPGIKAYTNFQFEDNGIRAWKGYNIGNGTLFLYSNLIGK